MKRIRVHMIHTARRLSRGAAFVAALAVVLGIITLSPVSASAAAQAHPASTVSASAPSFGAHQVGLYPAFTLPKCMPVIDSYDRTHECWLESITFPFRKDNELIGTLEVVIFQYITLVANSAKWSEEDEVVAAIPAGVTAPVTATLSASCGAHCTAHAFFTGVLKGGLNGSVTYSTSIGKNAKITTPTQYTLAYESPPFISTNIPKWNSPWDYRCDNGLATAGTGCVVPEYIPTLDISRGTYGAAAAMIAWAQKNLDGHWGVKGEGDPLKRLNNPKVGTPAGNRKVICKRKSMPFGLWKAGSVTMSDSCDEFPFAGTYQSGAMPPDPVANGAECAQVKAVKTSDTGDNPARLWNSIEVIGTFSAHDKCVRGHIPIKLNVDLGSKGYQALINSARLINEDPFWVAVTS